MRGSPRCGFGPSLVRRHWERIRAQTTYRSTTVQRRRGTNFRADAADPNSGLAQLSAQLQALTVTDRGADRVARDGDAADGSRDRRSRGRCSIFIDPFIERVVGADWMSRYSSYAPRRRGSRGLSALPRLDDLEAFERIVCSRRRSGCFRPRAGSRWRAREHACDFGSAHVTADHVDRFRRFGGPAPGERLVQAAYPSRCAHRVQRRQLLAARLGVEGRRRLTSRRSEAQAIRLLYS